MTKPRERRYLIEVPVEVGVGRAKTSATTHDVGAKGLFVRGAIVGPVRALVTLDLELPFGLGDVSVHGMIVHTVPATTNGAPCAVPGMGIALYGLDGPARDLWARFIDEARAQATVLEVKPLVAVRASRSPPRALIARHADVRAVLEVRAPLLRDLVEMYTRDLVQGTILLQTDYALGRGEGFVLCIVHPGRGDSLSVPCRVTRVIDDPTMRGVEADVLDLDDNARALFWEFIGVEVAQLEREEVIVVQESG